MPNVQCINCHVRLTRIRRHALIEEGNVVVDTIRLWTYPREITPSDHICQACWELAMHGSSSSIDVPERHVGHCHVCVVCGRSILRISRRRIIYDDANADQQRLASLISVWIQPRELTPADEACVPCWLRALRQRDEQVHAVQSQLDNQNANSPPEITDPIAVCSLCGNYLLSTERQTVSRDGRQILEIITRLLVSQQMPPPNEICLACLEYAQDIAQNNEDENNNEQFISLPNIRRAAETPSHCIFQECTGPQRHVIPEETRNQVLLQFQYFIPKGARICTNHLQNENYQALYAAEYSLDTFKASYIEEIVFTLKENIKNINYENIQNYPDNQVEYFIGITKRQHEEILNETPNLKNMHRGSFALTVLLCKLRTGDSGNRLSCLFKVPRRTLETLMNVARQILIRDYVPRHLGFGHMRIDQVAAKNSIVADGIFGEPEEPMLSKPAIILADATYLYTQKSSNYLFQKETYSLHKYRNLLKPFVLCCCDGYIIDVRGPYSATTNDATIMRELLNEPQFNDFFRENDIFILDRGFRDCIDALHEKGYLAHIPETKEDGRFQLTTLEANRSRCVTINRWVVEAVNGRFKRDFKIFRHEYFNRACSHLMGDFKIAAALLNHFCVQFSNSDNAEQFVNIIHDRLFLTNVIADLVANLNLNRRSSLFIPIDSATMSFPRMSMDDLILFACGTYQIRQARSYVGEHFRFHGTYSLEVNRDQILGIEGINPILIRAKIKSRHASGKTYFVFIVHELNLNGREAILGYSCNCIVGLRTVGCCSHVMSIIWYLSYARHEGMTQPASFLDEVILRVN